ncbi:MAG: hypothetical protein MI924_30405 [Chloroflexales bacterium]|nr:hypothetical protein [Chloroflexales bacterium]
MSHVSLFGSFRVAIDEQHIIAAMWRWQKAKVIVKLLAFTSSYALQHEQVLEALRPDVSPEAAAYNRHAA